MKKLLGILVLGLLFYNIGYSDNRYDKYSCEYADRSGTEPLIITNNEITWDNYAFPLTAPIKKETKKIIYAVENEGKDFEVNLTFYKKTKKLKLVFVSSDTYKMNCTQLD